MKWIFKHTLLVASLLTLGACVPKENLKPVEFVRNTEQPYPALSIYSKLPSAELASECKEYDGRSLIHHCLLDQYDITEIMTALSDTRLFQKVDLANQNNDYSLSISSATYNLEDAGELTSAVAAGASLFVIPMTTTRDVKLELDLAWRGISIKQYRYELPLTMHYSLLHLDGGEKANKQFADAVVSRFLHDGQSEKVFSGEYLADALQASDYVNDLLMPDRVGDYFFENKYIYPDPFLGATSRYVHGVISRYIDVYTYPIKGVEWNDTNALLDAEGGSNKKCSAS